MNDKHIILTIAKREIEKELDKLQKDLQRKSDKLLSMDMNNTSVRIRATQRVKISCAAEERDRWKNRLDIATKWADEIWKEGITNE
jgi:hypothetical protein